MNHKRNRPKKRRAGEGRVEVEIAPAPMQLKKRGKGVVSVPDAELPPLTAEQVRDTMERIRRGGMDGDSPHNFRARRVGRRDRGRLRR